MRKLMIILCICAMVMLSFSTIAYAHPDRRSEWRGFTVTKRTSPADSLKPQRTRAIQMILSCCSFDSDVYCCGVDGSFGEKTENCVKAFQFHEGLSNDGSVGPATWGALYGKLGIGSYNAGYYWYYTGTNSGGGMEPEDDIIRRGDPSGRWQVYNYDVNAFTTFEYAQ